MVGGVSHLESFDPKPALNKYAGMKISETPYADGINKYPAFASEFGRTPGVETAEIQANTREGRDHHPFGFSVWLAGGGIKGGNVHGVTDELGFHAVENRHYVPDIHATILHQLGLEPERLDAPGRKRIEKDYGQSIREIIA